MFLFEEPWRRKEHAFCLGQFPPSPNMHLQPNFFELIKDELCTQCDLLPILELKGAIIDVEHVEQI